MLGFLVDTDEILFAVFATGMFIFSLLALFPIQKTRNSVIYGLTGALFTSGFVAFVSNAVIATALSTIYLSLFAMFLTTTNDGRRAKKKVGKFPVVMLSLILVAGGIAYFREEVPFDGECVGSHYSGVGEVTLVACLLFLLVLHGVISVCRSSGK